MVGRHGNACGLGMRYGAGRGSDRGSGVSGELEAPPMLPYVPYPCYIAETTCS